MTGQQMAALQEELEATKKERDELNQECDRLRNLAPTTELPDSLTLLERLRAKHPRFKSKNGKPVILEKDVELILELLHPS